MVGMAVAVFWTAERFAAEPLLACVLAGVIATNRKCACALLCRHLVKGCIVILLAACSGSQDGFRGACNANNARFKQ